MVHLKEKYFILEKLSIVQTCLRWKPVYSGNLSMVEN